MTISPSFVLILGLLSCYVYGQNPSSLNCRDQSEKKMNMCSPDDENCVAVQQFRDNNVNCTTNYELIGQQGNRWYFVDHAEECSIQQEKFVAGLSKHSFDVLLCRKKKGCNQALFYDENVLYENVYAVKPLITNDNEWQCPEDYKLGINYEIKDKNSARKGLIEFYEKEEIRVICENGRLSAQKQFTFENGFNLFPEDLIPRRVRCARPKTCSMNEFYYENLCDTNKVECKKPMTESENIAKCDPDFGLQGKYVRDGPEGIWQDVGSHARCFMGPGETNWAYYPIKKDNNPIMIDENSNIYALRCVKLKLNSFLSCDPKLNEDCREPLSCNPMTCDKGYALQMKFEREDNWKVVQSARCDSDKFNEIRVDGGAIKDQPVLNVKCARRKCALCENPCPTCGRTEFTNFMVWDQCSKFSCGPKTRTFIGNQKFNFELNLTCVGGNMWKTAEGSSKTTQEDVKCETLCTLKSPINSVCDGDNGHCKTVKLSDDETVTCTSDMSLYYTEGDRTREVTQLSCDLTNGLWTYINNNKLAVGPNGNVYCHVGCAVDSYYHSPCGDEKNECAKPNFANNVVKCSDSDFGLQVSTTTKEGSIWTDASSVICDNFRFKAKLHDNSVIEPRILNGIRCIRKKIEKFFRGLSQCEQDEICKQPKPCASITCDDKKMWKLMLNVDSNSEWIEVDSARCNSNKFIYVENNIEKSVETPQGIKCVQKKCSTCVDDPCQNCDPEFENVFTKSTKWNECAKFDCGAHMRTTFISTSKELENVKLECISKDENGPTKWRISTITTKPNEIEAEKIKCEKLCTLSSKLKSESCDPFDSVCEKIELNNDKRVACKDNKSLFLITGSQVEDGFSQLECNNRNGIWKIITNGGVEKNLKEGSVYCHFGCKFESYYKVGDCEKDEECAKPKESITKPCVDDYGLQVKFNNNPGGWMDIKKISCEKHRFRVHSHDGILINGSPYAIRCIRKNITTFFEESLCDDSIDCKKPSNCTKISCEDKWALQITASVSLPHKWDVVDSLRCDSDEFNSLNFEDVTKDVTKIRCVRRKCTQCGNPSKTFGKFKVSTKWNECSEFECGQYTNTIIGSDPNEMIALPNAKLICDSYDNEVAVWKVGNQKHNTKTVACEKSCSLQYPLVRKCDPKDKLCDEWTPQDKHPKKCSRTMFMHLKGKKFVPIEIEIDELSCEDGLWSFKSKIEKNKKQIINDNEDFVSCHAGCNVSSYFTTCEAENECKMPILNATSNQLICEDDEFGLQIDTGSQPSAPEWQDVSNIDCTAHRFKAFKNGNSAIQSFTNGIRCIRKNLDHFFKGCESDQNCHKPKNCTLLECEPDWALRMKFENGWIEVNSASCNSNTFNVKQLNGKQPTEVQCVRKKCSMCLSPCDNCHIKSSALFIEPKKWDDCSKFTCGEHAQIFIKNANKKLKDNETLTCKEFKDTETLWSAVEGNEYSTSKDVICENSCEQKSPLNSTCKENDNTCEPLPQNVRECPKKMFYESEGGSPEEIRNLECIMEQGTWKATKVTDGSEIGIRKGNVYCHAGDCEIERIFPTCRDDEVECVDFLREGNRFFCGENGDANFWKRESHNDDWIKMNDVKELFCKAGSILVGGKPMPYDFQASCRIDKVAAQKAGSKIPLFLGVTLLLIITVFVVATIVLKVTGSDWLHIIIINHFRPKKRKSRPRRAISKSATVSKTSVTASSGKETTPPQISRTKKSTSLAASPKSRIDRETTEELFTKTADDVNSRIYAI